MDHLPQNVKMEWEVDSPEAVSSYPYWVPAAAVPSSTYYGGLDPGNEDTMPMLNFVSDEGLRGGGFNQRKMLDTSSDHYYPPVAYVSGSAPLNAPRNGSCPILGLPIELVDSILSYLSPVDLVAVSATCRDLHHYATAELHWARRVQANVPGVRLQSPWPCRTYQELYVAHDPRWFLPKYKIWFCDRELTGRLVIARYDPSHGCIEGYQLVAVSNRTTFQHWPADQHVVIHAFEPRVQLHLDKPVLQFTVDDGYVDAGRSERRRRPFAAEVPMHLEDGSDSLFSNFMLARALDVDSAARGLACPYPYGHVWPPPAVPARHRIAGFYPSPPPRPLGTAPHSFGFGPTADQDDEDDAGAFPAPEDRPMCRAEASDQTFRIRHWMEMAGVSPLRSMFLRRALETVGRSGRSMIGVGAGFHVPPMTRVGSHIGEEIFSYSTLDPRLYTPTALKPWRGIWVGDYSGHGCEFLLVHQPDDDAADMAGDAGYGVDGLGPSDRRLGLQRYFDESDAQWEARRHDARIYRGRLEAIKLTGDHNVPRGEYTFVADDLGDRGCVGVAQEAPFAGTRVVRSRGHVANAGFHNDKYIESQLLLISGDRLAQYWVGFGHISFFERVDIDRFLDPSVNEVTGSGAHRQYASQYASQH